MEKPGTTLTRSPTRNRVTSGPTAETVPLHSYPSPAGSVVASM